MQQATIHPSALGSARLDTSGTADSSSDDAAGGVSEAQMRMVLDISRLLAVTTDIDELLCRIAQCATILLGCERASIFLHDRNADELWTKVALLSGEIRIPSSKGIAGHCFSKAELICVPEPY